MLWFIFIGIRHSRKYLIFYVAFGYACSSCSCHSNFSICVKKLLIIFDLFMRHSSIYHILRSRCPSYNILNYSLFSIIMDLWNWDQKLIIIEIFVHLLLNYRERTIYHPYLTSHIFKVTEEVYQTFFRYYFWHFIETIQIIKLSFYFSDWKPMRPHMH